MEYSLFDEIKKLGLTPEEAKKDIIVYPPSNGICALALEGVIVGCCDEMYYNAVKGGDFSSVKRFGLSINEFNSRMLHANVAAAGQIIDRICFRLRGRNAVYYPMQIDYDSENKRITVLVDSGF